MNKALVTKISVMALALVSISCDPGYRLKPAGWQPLSDHEWSRDFGDFQIQTRGIGGLIGEWWIYPDLRIYNNSLPISVQSAELLTDKERFEAEIYKTEPISQNEKGYDLPIRWEFRNRRAAPTVLGAHCTIKVRLKVGSQAREIAIEYDLTTDV